MEMIISPFRYSTITNGSFFMIKARKMMMIEFAVFIGLLILFLSNHQVSAAAAAATDDDDGGVNPLVEHSSRTDLVNIAGYGEEKLSTVTITGKVLCHACMGGKFPVPTHPVSGAKVGVFCGNVKLKKSWARATTGEYGDFFIDLPSHLHAIPNLEKVCLLQVLQLPRGSLCRPAFTGQHKDLKLVYIGDGVRAYTADDILLMPRALGAGARKRTRPN